MSDNQIPELRLPGDAAAAVQTAPAAEPVAADPSLMLDNLTEEEKATAKKLMQANVFN